MQQFLNNSHLTTDNRKTRALRKQRSKAIQIEDQKRSRSPYDVYTPFVSRTNCPMVLSHPLPPPLAAAIFDFDGIIADTIYLHYSSWQRLADEESIPFDYARHEGMLGMNREDSLAYLLEERQVTPEKWQQLLDRKNQYYLKSVRTLDRSCLLPGIESLLYELRHRGIKIALGSSSKNARRILQQLQIDFLFDAIVDGNNVKKLKPSPDVFLLAAELLRLPPAACVVFEDAAAGIAAARSAGMWAIAVTAEAHLQKAHLHYPSLAGVGWSQIVTDLKSVSREGADLRGSVGKVLAIG